MIFEHLHISIYSETKSSLPHKQPQTPLHSLAHPLPRYHPADNSHPVIYEGTKIMEILNETRSYGHFKTWQPCTEESIHSIGTHH